MLVLRRLGRRSGRQHRTDVAEALADIRQELLRRRGKQRQNTRQTRHTFGNLTFLEADSVETLESYKKAAASFSKVNILWPRKRCTGRLGRTLLGGIQALDRRTCVRGDAVPGTRFSVVAMGGALKGWRRLCLSQS